MKEHILHPDQQKKFAKDLVHTIPDPQPDLHLLIHEKTIIYPTDEMLRKKKQKFRDAYAQAWFQTIENSTCRLTTSYSLYQIGVFRSLRFLD